MAHIAVDKYITPAQRQAINLLASYGRSTGIGIHLFGGFVRDVVIGAVPKDVDVRMDVPDIGSAANRFVEWLGGRCAGVYSNPHVVAVRVRTAAGEVALDLTRQEGHTIDKDSLIHDLTVNSLAVSVHDVALGRPARVVGPRSGLRDVSDGVIRMTYKESFNDDPVRVLRALRFSHQLGYRIDPRTMAAAKAAAPMLRDAPGERIRAELAKLLPVRPYGAAVALMEEAGALDAVFPELQACRGVTQPSNYHVHDVYGHLVATVGELDRMEGEFDLDFGPEVEAYFDEPVGDGLTRRQLMPFAALLHDIGKPETASVRPDGNPQFLDHEVVGAHAVSSICKRLRFSGAARDFLVSVVRHHMRPWSISPAGRIPTPKAVRKFYQRAGDTAVAVLVLHLADLRGSRVYMLTPEEWDARVAFVRRMIDWVQELGRKMTLLAAEPPLLNGHDLMGMGVPQGPEVGRLLRLVVDAREEGAISSREEAVGLVEAHRDDSGEAV